MNDRSNSISLLMIGRGLWCRGAVGDVCVTRGLREDVVGDDLPGVHDGADWRRCGDDVRAGGGELPGEEQGIQAIYERGEVHIVRPRLCGSWRGGVGISHPRCEVHDEHPAAAAEAAVDAGAGAGVEDAGLDEV